MLQIRWKMLRLSISLILDQIRILDLKFSQKSWRKKPRTKMSSLHQTTSRWDSLKTKNNSQNSSSKTTVDFSSLKISGPKSITIMSKKLSKRKNHMRQKLRTLRTRYSINSRPKRTGLSILVLQRWTSSSNAPGKFWLNKPHNLSMNMVKNLQMTWHMMATHSPWNYATNKWRTY